MAWILGCLTPMPSFPRLLFHFQIHGHDSTKQSQARNVHHDQLKLNLIAHMLKHDWSLESSQRRDTEAGNYLVARGQWKKGQKPEGHAIPLQISVLTVSRLLLNFVVFSIYSKKVISNSLSSWWWHTDLYQNFQLDLLKPEKVNGTESRALTTLQLRLLGSLLFALSLITPTICLILRCIRQKSNTTSHPMSVIFKFWLCKMHWESRKLYFM